MHHVEEQGFERVVPVVAERQDARAAPLRVRVEDAPPQARAQRAVRLARLRLVHDDAVRVLLDDLEVDADVVLEPRAQRLDVVAGLLLIQMDGDDVEIDAAEEPPLLRLLEQVEECVAVLAAAARHEDLRAVLDHAVL